MIGLVVLLVVVGVIALLAWLSAQEDKKPMQD